GPRARARTARRRRRRPGAGPPLRGAASPGVDGTTHRGASASTTVGTPASPPDRRIRRARAPARAARGAPPSPGAAPAPGGTRRTSPGGRRAPRALRRRARRPPEVRAARGRPGMSREEALQFFLEVEARAVEAGTDRADRELQHLRDLLVREALDVAQDDDNAALLRQLADRAVERLLQLATLERLIGSGVRIGEPRERVVT